ncbi:MAG: hypothetical protein ACUVWR_16345 [Anaerolineae bacterium]
MSEQSWKRERFSAALPDLKPLKASIHTELVEQDEGLAAAGRGWRLALTVTVRNKGEGAAENFWVGAYFADEVSPDVTLAAVYWLVPFLAPGTNATLDLASAFGQPELALPGGRYLLSVEANIAYSGSAPIAESSGDNNVLGPLDFEIVDPNPQPTATETPMLVATDIASPAPSASATPTPTATGTPTTEPIATGSPTPTATGTPTPEPTATATGPAPAPNDTPTPEPPTPMPMDTPLPPPTETPTNTPEPTATASEQPASGGAQFGPCAPPCYTLAQFGAPVAVAHNIFPSRQDGSRQLCEEVVGYEVPCPGLPWRDGRAPDRAYICASREAYRIRALYAACFRAVSCFRDPNVLSRYRGPSVTMANLCVRLV